MRVTRRRLFGLAGAAVAIPAAARRGWAQTYPSRPVKLIVPVAAGGANDTTARLFAQKLAESLGQQFYVENVPGAGGNLGIANAARAPADGYTLARRRRQLPHQSEPLCEDTLRSRTRISRR